MTSVAVCPAGCVPSFISQVHACGYQNERAFNMRMEDVRDCAVASCATDSQMDSWA